MTGHEQIADILRTALIENQIALPSDLDFATSEIRLSDIDLDSISLVYVVMAFETRLSIDDLNFEIDETTKIRDLYSQIYQAANRT